MASATIASTPYRPPLASGTPTAVESPTRIDYSTSTAQPGHTDVYLYYFIVPYLDAHVLSPPSWRYAYSFWIFIFAVLAIWTAIFQLRRLVYSHQNRAPLTQNASSHTSKFNSTSSFHPLRWFRALLIRRLIPRSATISNPSDRLSPSQIPRWYSSNINIGQALTLLTFTAVLLALSLVGDDYISPTTCTWGGTCPVQVFNQGPPKSSYLPRSLRSRLRRSDIASAPQPALAPYQKLTRRHDNVLQPRASALSLNPNGWAPFNDPLLAAPNTNVKRTMWTLSSRFGLIAYAMIPFVVTIGLKSWPFNIFAIPWLTHYGFDRSSVIHRWTGRLIWVWSTIHTITFSIQLGRDLNPYGNMILMDVWQYYRFNWGVAAYVALTITVGFSFNPLRNRYYEFFYCSHVVLSIVFLVGCIIHYEPLWAWSVIGLTLWGAERGCRLIIWLWFNGFFDNPKSFWSNKPSALYLQGSHTSPKTTEDASLGALMDGDHNYPPICSPPLHAPDSPLPPSFQQAHARSVPKTLSSIFQTPPGFALVQVLPGHTLRITLRMVKEARWEVGQYLLLCVPSVSWWQTHPYTICCSSILSELDAANRPDRGKKVVLLLRARQGFSKRIYELAVSAKSDEGHDGTSTRLADGILMRCQISRPLGSSGRMGWDLMDNLLIICGGSGISFGISTLEDTCVKLWNQSRQKAVKNVPKSRISRVRLVWIFREYAHLSWVAAALKRCLTMVSEEELQVELYVSNSLRRKKQIQPPQDSSITLQGIPNQHQANAPDSQTLLKPPHPAFLQWDSDSDSTSLPPRNSFTSSITATGSELSEISESQDAPGGFTDFEGEVQQDTDAERIVSHSVKLEGKKRRKNTLRRAKKGGWKTAGKIFGTKGIKEQESEDEQVTETRKSGRMFLENDEKQRADEQLEHSSDTPWKDQVLREIGIDLLAHEIQALEELSEAIKTGRPKLEKTLDEEVERSAGRILVACCGPESLNSHMRSLVSRHHLRLKSDKEVNVYTEDFSY